ncbi:MAG: M14 family metallopeptidase [Thermomicrobiales bacterium]
MAGANFAELHFLAEGAEWRTDRYYTYDVMTELLRGWVAAYPGLATLGSIGQSGEGREIWVVTITNWATGSDREKPAYYIDANIHAGEVTTSSVALATIHHLLTRYDSDAEVRRLLDETAVYVIPRIAVDGGEIFLRTPATLRSSPMIYPAGAEYDGLEAQDVDGDGLIGSMRLKDPAGPWKVSERDPRIMLQRAPHEFGGEYYFLLPEGVIRNWDGGKIAVAPSPMGLDFNRNFPKDWKPEWSQFGSGPLPLSAPETKAIAAFLLDHRNIHGAQLHHTAAGMILRASALYSDEQIPPLDLRASKAIGAIGEASTGYPCLSPFHSNPYQPGKPSYGVSIDWLYDDLGIIGYMTELWGLAHHAGVKYTKWIELEESRSEDDDLLILRYLDERAGGRGFAPWRPFEHPQLGPVELGGYEFKFGMMNPPGPLLPDIIAGAVPFAIGAMGSAPHLRIIDSGAERLEAGVYRVWANFGNEGFLPTSGSERYKERGKGQPIKATIALPEGTRLLPGTAKAEQQLEHLAGRVSQFTSFPFSARFPNLSRGHVEWLVAAPAGSVFEVTVRTEKAGVGRVRVVTE